MRHRTASFIVRLAVQGLALAMMIGSQSASAFPKGDGHLTIYNYHLGELANINFKDNHKASRQIEHIFRSRMDDKEHKIDPDLIELLDNIQDHFGADSLELISGYRSPELNRQLKENSINVAEESMHLEGKAADIHIDEATEEAVAEYVRSLKVGGVGYYPAFDFVHVDVGEVRNWDLPDKPGRLLMAMRKGAMWQVTTDRDIYLPDEEIEYEVLNITRTPKIFDKKVSLEIYRRGKWQKVHEPEDFAHKKLKAGESLKASFKPNGDSQFGKYRITIAGPKEFQHLQVRSNEFYRKKF